VRAMEGGEGKERARGEMGKEKGKRGSVEAAGGRGVARRRDDETARRRSAEAAGEARRRDDEACVKIEKGLKKRNQDKVSHHGRRTKKAAT
jgi:hypothetical protein